ncbi:unnamed protein product [Mycena citricolor]|uniref:Dol-P-Man:Man(5)GlcNAc(2)-PP-Dol alpha-1,3-mannosyltransferase n=1 Tax=Mycena citricolor TaxID=2018698 RepID=A0AAD2K3Z6_9AGAR|nr:unnamed protein product [Mycena citricolor]
MPPTLQHVRKYVHLLLSDRRYFWWLASLVIIGDFVLSQLIILVVSYTEIDWETYMIQTEVYMKGELDYSQISGPPVRLCMLYPAGHLHIHKILHAFTDGGRNIPQAQQIYAALYTVSVALTCTTYWLAGGVPNWIVLLLPLSRRLHSIYVLRLFNDCWAVVFVQLSIVAYQTGFDDVGTLLFSAALSVKMSILLYAPALLVLIFNRLGALATFRHVVTLVASQAMIGLSFLEYDHWAYLNSAFELSRVFLYKWTVNWRMVSEETFLSRPWANGLLLGILAACLLLDCSCGSKRWRRLAGPQARLDETRRASASRAHNRRLCGNHSLHLQPDRHHIRPILALPVLCLVCPAAAIPRLEDKISDSRQNRLATCRRICVEHLPVDSHVFHGSSHRKLRAAGRNLDGISERHCLMT